jgi:hypothetical protein
MIAMPRVRTALTILCVLLSPCAIRAQDAPTNVYLLDGGAFTNALMANSMVEQFATIGMLTAGTQLALQERPNEEIAAKLSAASAGYLRLFLKTDPARVRFSERGIVFQPSK